MQAIINEAPNGHVARPLTSEVSHEVDFDRYVAEDSAILNAATSDQANPTSQPAEKTSVTYFFYGSLQHVEVLKDILCLDEDEEPQLTRATITGYKIRMWGAFPALVASEGNVVPGMAYEVDGKQREDRLRYYETSNYRPVSISIKLEDGTELDGKMFVWNSYEGELEDGIFDIKTYRPYWLW